MTSIAERRRRKKARITLPGGQQIDQKPSGRDRVDVGQRKQAEDARRGPLEARCRVAGISITPDSLKAAVAPDFGHDVGLCIRAILVGDDAAKAWGLFMEMTAAHRNYMILYVGSSGAVKCASPTMVPEQVEIDPSLRVDLRTEEEKIRAARHVWAAWEKRIAALPFPQMKWAINGTLRGFLGEGILWRDAKPTDTGRTVVAALRAMVA